MFNLLLVGWGVETEFRGVGFVTVIPAVDNACQKPMREHTGRCAELMVGLRQPQFARVRSGVRAAKQRRRNDKHTNRTLHETLNVIDWLSNRTNHRYIYHETSIADIWTIVSCRSSDTCRWGQAMQAGSRIKSPRDCRVSLQEG